MTDNMPMRRLGRSGLVVSRLVLGTMMFGGRTDEAEARRIVDDARAEGVNFIDTADAYNAGVSEEITGRAIAADRWHWILATKLANPMGDGPHQRGLSRRWMIEATERSLRRLGTDAIDIQYLHKEDNATPLEETVATMGDLIRQGKIRYFGVSNHRSWRLARIVALCDAMGIARPVVCQLYYHALYRAAEMELLPACDAMGLGTVAYSPLARGVLTAKYADLASPPPDSRAAANDKRLQETEWNPANLAAAARLGDHASARGMALADFACGWVLANPFVTGLIAGPRTFGQWRGYLGGLRAAIGPEDESAVDAVAPPGTSAIPHYVDPSYPAEGRPLPRA